MWKVCGRGSFCVVFSRLTTRWQRYLIFSHLTLHVTKQTETGGSIMHSKCNRILCIVTLYPGFLPYTALIQILPHLSSSCYLSTCAYLFLLLSRPDRSTLSGLSGLSLNVCLFSLCTAATSTTCLSTTATRSATRWLSSSRGKRSRRTSPTSHLKF